MPKLTLSHLQRYGVAVLAVAIALVFRLLLMPLLGDNAPFLPFLLAVMFSAWYSGITAGIIGTALSAIAIPFFFLNQCHDFGFKYLTHGLLVGQFLLAGVAISCISEALHKARTSAEVNAQQAQVHLECLEESEQRFGLLLEAVKDYAIYMLDTQGRVFLWNQGAERIKGYRPEEIVGKNFSCFYTPEDIALKKPEQALSIAATQGRYETEGWRQRKDGSHFWADVVLTALYDENGKLKGFSKVTRDITERKRAEEERIQLLIREQAARAEAEAAVQRVQSLQAVTDAAIASLSLDDLLSQLLERITEILKVDTVTILLLEPETNSLVVRATKGLEKEVEDQVRIPIGYGFAGRIAAERQPLLIVNDAYTQAISSVLKEKQVQSLMGVPLLLQDKILGVLNVGSLSVRQFTQDDIKLLQLVAERLVLAIERATLYEAEQKARTEAEAANRLKDEFLAIVSHELRTPIQSILGWAQMLRSRKLNENTINKALDTMERNAKQQVKLIDDILDASKIIRGDIRLHLLPVNLNPIIEIAIRSLSSAASTKNIQVESLCPHVGKVCGDPDRLQQIIWNLLSNAIKFTPEGGRVEIRLERIEQKAEYQADKIGFISNSESSCLAAHSNSENSYVQLTVSDTGIGISPEFIPFVYEGFRQADSSITRTYGGLGLGLTIVRYLVEMHDGTVQVVSEGKGKGSTFTVRLPCIEKNTAEEEPNTGEDCTQISSPRLLTRAVVA